MVQTTLAGLKLLVLYGTAMFGKWWHCFNFNQSCRVELRTTEEVKYFNPTFWSDALYSRLTLGVVVESYFAFLCCILGGWCLIHSWRTLQFLYYQSG